MEFKKMYKEYQPYLFSIAYRMLGSVTDAEDIVHDSLLQMNQKTAHIKDLKSYLAKTTTNHCINFLKSARTQRETYTGTWLPEPQVHFIKQPLDKVITDEAISYAFLVLMEQLTPTERAVFVLKEAMAYHYVEIANIINKTEVNTRKIYSRAKKKLQNDLFSAHTNHADRAENLTKSFLDATTTGDFDEFIHVLTEDVVLVTDGGGKVLAAIYPILNKRRVSAFLKGIFSKGSFSGKLYAVIVNGQQGILQVKDGRPVKIITFALDRSQKNISRIYIVSNPDKLNRISIPRH
ncbi:MAG: RNA polymerase sigma-70 factor [Bacillota bacterium]|uniref:RNA polymerase sigma-70 factor n=2 Tax=Virgibacillus salarius TaxID=447199 RepID=A0A941DUY0_9BACI|nr:MULTISPECIES: RNA polymerase sigma-70 factor [Bacillaceae]MBR7797210.1 RNA polymerase sigma-70 factor [Virgibacillus salarius]MDY7045986.1 RNA polymerase sigma-70 factor [Virgibacillus sp. M23]NAZ09919.1 RNA polymerase sigma-70 factor [Agaribacter marinus]